MTHEKIMYIAAANGFGQVHFQFNIAKNTGRQFEVGYVVINGRMELFCKRSHGACTPFRLCNEFAALDGEEPDVTTSVEKLRIQRDEGINAQVKDNVRTSNKKDSSGQVTDDMIVLRTHGGLYLEDSPSAAFRPILGQLKHATVFSPSDAMLDDIIKRCGEPMIKVKVRRTIEVL